MDVFLSPRPYADWQNSSAISPTCRPETWLDRVGRSGQRAGLKPEQVDEVIFGNVVQAGVGQNRPGRRPYSHGLPDSIAAFTGQQGVPGPDGRRPCLGPNDQGSDAEIGGCRRHGEHEPGPVSRGRVFAAA